MAKMEPQHLFCLERHRRDIETCSDVQELRSTAIKLLQLYLAQQESLTAMMRQGWLPAPPTS